eukprot:5644076-Alexandrium_andersonii.AAC.1
MVQTPSRRQQRRPAKPPAAKARRQRPIATSARFLRSATAKRPPSAVNCAECVRKAAPMRRRIGPNARTPIAAQQGRVHAAVVVHEQGSCEATRAQEARGGKALQAAEERRREAAEQGTAEAKQQRAEGR